MNARKGPILASVGLGFLAASLLLSPPLRGASGSAVEAAARGIKVLVANGPDSPLPVREVADPAAARMPFAKWLKVDLSSGDQIVKVHFFDVPEGQRAVLEYANVDMCTQKGVKDATINLMAGYKDPTTGQMFDQHIKLITQPQGIFPDDDEPEALYAHFGVSQPMSLYLGPGTPVFAWIYRSDSKAGHSEANIWVSGYFLPAPAGQ
jgi:hypothetical protein